MGADAPLLAALREARFRLLRLEPADGTARRTACDALSGEAMVLPAGAFAPLAGGDFLFARVARLPDGSHYCAGARTPLDEAALAAARRHGAAGSASGFGNVRWAEAIYAHVVRHGTRDVPGVNRPREAGGADDWLGPTEDPMLRLAHQWRDLAGAAPGAALLQCTREASDLQNIMNGVIGAVVCAVLARPRLPTPSNA